MSWLSKIFGGGGSNAAATVPETYKDFSITPQPQRDANGWRIAALIEKDGKSHTLIRADLLESFDAAAEASIRKGKQMIDEQGERLFG